MPCSEARLLANRQNALRSTGPKTVAGKEVARRNSLKHGLTGQGVVIPGEDEHEVAGRIEALETELAPAGGVMARLLVRQVAALTVRNERCYRHETAVTAERVRNAAEVFDEERRAEADHLLSHIAQEPATYYRRLMAMPEGVDLLIGRLRQLLTATAGVGCILWTENHGYEFDLCTGHRIGSIPVTRGSLLTRAIVAQDFERLDPAEHAHFAPKGKVEWALRAIGKLLTAEIARLETHRGTLDRAGVTLSRSEAGERALIDPSPAGTIVRKYQASTERAIYRALRELRDLRQTAQPAPLDPATVGQAVQVVATELAEVSQLPSQLGSFSPEPLPAVSCAPGVSNATGFPGSEAENLPARTPRTTSGAPRSLPRLR